jgi:hypothetical protein
MQEFRGTIEFLDIEGGVWVLTLPSGQHYALFRAPKELLQEGIAGYHSGAGEGRLGNNSAGGPSLGGKKLPEAALAN